MKARSKPKLRVPLFFLLLYFLSREGPNERLLNRESCSALAEQEQSHSATSPLTLSLASLGTRLASVCQETGAQRAGGTEYSCIPPRHGVSTWLQEGGIIPQTFHLNTPTLCAPEQVTIFPAFLLKCTRCCCNTTAPELATSEYNRQVFLVKIKCEH